MANNVRVFGLFKDYSVRILDYDGTYEIIKYIGKDISPVIPQVINGIKLTSIGYKAFYESRIVFLNVPEGITRIDQAAFQNCKDLISVSLPSTLKYFNDNSFMNCDNIEEIEINNNPIYTTFGNSCCIVRKNILVSGFKNSKIPEGVEEIKDYAFGCVPIENVTFPSTLKKIGIGAFRDSNIKKLFIPKNVEIIKDGAFEGCKHLTEVEIESGNLKEIPTVCFNESGLKKAILPNTIKRILYNAFGNCKNLDLAVPSSVIELKTQNRTTYHKLKLPLHFCSIKYDKMCFGAYFEDVCSVLELSKTNVMNDDYSIDFEEKGRMVRTELDSNGYYKKSYYLDTKEPITLTVKNTPQDYLFLIKNYNDILSHYRECFKNMLVANRINFNKFILEEMVDNPLMKDVLGMCAFKRASALVVDRNMEDRMCYGLLDHLNLKQLDDLLALTLEYDYAAGGAFLVNYRKGKYGYEDGSSLSLD